MARNPILFHSSWSKITLGVAICIKPINVLHFPLYNSNLYDCTVQYQASLFYNYKTLQPKVKTDQYTVYIVLYKSSTFNIFPENTSKPDVQINYKIIKLLLVYICTENVFFLQTGHYKSPARVIFTTSEWKWVYNVTKSIFSPFKCLKTFAIWKLNNMFSSCKVAKTIVG